MMSRDIKTFDDVRRMSNKDLSEWLTLIWKTGWNVAKIGSPITNCPNFYERLNNNTNYDDDFKENYNSYIEQ